MKEEKKSNEIEEKILEELVHTSNGEVITYKDLNEALNKIRGNLIQKLLDKEFDNHMQYQKGSHEEKGTNN